MIKVLIKNSLGDIKNIGEFKDQQSAEAWSDKERNNFIHDPIIEYIDQSQEKAIQEKIEKKRRNREFCFNLFDSFSALIDQLELSNESDELKESVGIKLLLGDLGKAKYLIQNSEFLPKDKKEQVLKEIDSFINSL